MKNGNPYESPIADSVQPPSAIESESTELPIHVLLIPTACVVAGLLIGVSYIQGFEEFELVDNPSNTSFRIARVSSLGNWLFAAAWTAGGIVIAALVLILTSRYHKWQSRNHKRHDISTT